MILIGVAIVAGLVVIIFLRGRDDYAYTIPRTGQWGCGQKSIDQAMQDAERGICNGTDID